MTSHKVQIIKQLYFTIVTIVVLAMILVSASYLIQSALYAYVFTGDEIAKGYPPAPYIVSEAKPSETIGCGETCELSESQKTEIRDWLTVYAEWKTVTPERVDRNGLVVALSFFIVAVPLFLIHYRMLRKEHAKAESEQRETVTFYVYYYIVALGTLIAGVVFAAMLIYATLSAWVIQDSSNISELQREVPITDSTVATVESCGEVCGFTEDELAVVAEYKADTENAEQYYTNESAWQRRFSTNIAGLLVMIPFFLYHWNIIRNKPKKQTTE